MARTYSSTPVMSKIKLPGGNTYYLKDADVRAILDAINDNVYESLKLALGTVDAGGNNLVTAGNIKDYVDRIAEISFDVVVLDELPTADESAYNTYHNNIVLIKDVTSKTGAYVEYVILRTEGEVEGTYVYNWEQIGTTELDLSGYLKNVSYVDATHTLQQTKNENGVDVTTNVHQFGNLADANTASTTYTPAGTITVNPLTQTATTATIDYEDYTPEGNISSVTVIDSVGTLPTKAKDTFTQGTLPSKAADTFDAGVLPSKAADTFNAGTLPSLTAQTTGTFAQAGIIANMDATDTEMLVFTTAATASAVTDRGTFDAGTAPTFTEGAFDAGTLPSYTEGAFDEGTLPTFVEGAFSQGALPTTKTVTPTFTGTKADDIIAKTVTYDKATSAGATFTGTQATITVNPDSRNQTN